MNKTQYIYGKNSCKAALESNSTIVGCLLASHFSDQEIINLIKERKIPIQRVEIRILDQMFSHAVHQGIALEISPYEYITLDEVIKKCAYKKDALVLLLDGIEDPMNLGSIIRSSDAFKVDAIIIPFSRSVSVTSSVVKASTGAVEYVPICRVSNLNQTIDTLKKHNFWIVASDGNAGIEYAELDYKMKVGLIIGSEGKGISKLILKNSDYVVKIPMQGHVNSLNAAVACAILLAQIALKRKN